MAKPTTPSTPKPTPNTRLIPKDTDQRAELFFLLGRLGDSQSANRIVELVIDLTAPVEQVASETEA